MRAKLLEGLGYYKQINEMKEINLFQLIVRKSRRRCVNQLPTATEELESIQKMCLQRKLMDYKVAGKSFHQSLNQWNLITTYINSWEIGRRKNHNQL